MEPIRRYHLDPQGEQVSDLVAFAKEDKREWLSSGRSIDYANTIYLTKSHVLYSDRSRPMFTLLEDEVKRRDFLLTPCSPETFNVFMNVLVAQDGELTIGPPTSKAGGISGTAGQDGPDRVRDDLFGRDEQQPLIQAH